MKCPIFLLILWSASVSPYASEFSGQVDRLVTSLRIPEERLQAVPQVLEHLHLMLSKRWPGSLVNVYGSIVDGLATTHSDIDSTVLLPHSSDTSQRFLEEASNQLQQYPHLIIDIKNITWVRVPVITFKHVPTQFQVDLTINNYNAIQISNLLNFLIHKGEGIFNLTFLVKHWAKVHKLTSTRTLPGYGIVLMVIFYLQQRNILPSIALLQKNAKPFFVDEWNYGFCEIEYDLINNVPLNLLLGGFFEFYADFDYDKYVVCPYTGYPIEKHLFVDNNKIPKEFSLYIHNVKANISMPLSIESDFVIQDVFIHNDNVAKAADTRPDSSFKKQFQFAAEKFRENNSNFLDKIL